MMSKLMRALHKAAGRMSSELRIAWFRACFPGLAIGPGVVLHRGVRIAVRNGAILHIGARSTIGAGAELHSEGELRIGDDAFIGRNTMIAAAEQVRIGKDALIGERSTIRDQDHRTDQRGLPYRLQGLTSSPVSIGNNVWLGAGSVVLKGVAIGDDCVVGANAVVTRSLDKGMRAVGIPARPIP